MDLNVAGKVDVQFRGFYNLVLIAYLQLIALVLQDYEIKHWRIDENLYLIVAKF